MSVTSINYDEPNPKTYESVRFGYENGNKEKIFNSGDFVKDWYDCVKFIIQLESNEYAHCNSSTVDHFIMDGAPFDSMYLVFDENEKPYLTNEQKGIEFFVKEGTTPTWLELKELCGDIKK